MWLTAHLQPVEQQSALARQLRHLTRQHRLRGRRVIGLGPPNPGAHWQLPEYAWVARSGSTRDVHRQGCVAGGLPWVATGPCSAAQARKEAQALLRKRQPAR